MSFIEEKVTKLYNYSHETNLIKMVFRHVR